MTYITPDSLTIHSSVPQAVLDLSRSLPSDTTLRDLVSPAFSTLYGRTATCKAKPSIIDKSEKKINMPLPKWQKRKSVKAAVGDVSETALSLTLPPLESCEVKSNILIPMRSRSPSLISEVVAMSDDI